MNVKLNEAFKELIGGITEKLGLTLTMIVLYGSVARGTEQMDSDVDIAIFLKKPLTKEMEDVLTDMTVDLNLKYGKVFSVIDILDGEYQKWKDISPFYKNISNEGVVLWKAA